MTSHAFKKILVASAVSTALFHAPGAIADETDIQLEGLKLTRFGDGLLVNVVFTETEEGFSETFAEASYLSAVAGLPIECDPQSAYPSAESSNDNPDTDIVGNWQGQDILMLEEEREQRWW